MAEHPERFGSPQGAWPGPGERFAGLTLVQELGRGAFARAYLARDPDTGDKPIVLKLSQAVSGEARTLGPIRHPHVVGIHWARQTEGLFAICLPFVGAATLRDAIDCAFDPAAGRRSARTLLDAIDRAVAPLPDRPDPAPPLLDARCSYPEAVAAVFARLAGALAHLHRLGIAHGDLKPTNVLLGPGGHPYLIDFNLAGRAGDSMLRCGGTLPYMAPERLRLLLGTSNNPGPADSADVYSLGVVVFEALTGRLPFEPPARADMHATAADLLRQSATGGRRPSGVPGALASSVERCLAADPAARPAAADVEQALARWLRRRVQRARAAWALGGVVAAGLAVGLLSSVRPSARETPADPPATSVASEPTTADGYFARGLGSLKAGYVASAMKDFDTANRLRPDGRNTAYFAYCQTRSGSHVAAAALFKEAIEKHGYNAAWVRCDRAYSLAQTGRVPALEEAVREATAALDLEPELRPARLNRAYARFLLARRSVPKSSPREVTEPLADVRAVLRIGPYTPDLYYEAAEIVVTFGEGREDNLAYAVYCLEQAVRYGLDPAGLRKDRVLAPALMNRADFTRLADLHGVPRDPDPSRLDVHLADPRGD
jgi:serine/threonine protein kinase